MGTEVLRIFLPSFIVIFICITFFWKWFRRITNANEYKDIEQVANYSRLQRINHVFKVVLLMFSFMTLIFSVYPEYYHMFIPLAVFDHPVINSIGILLLKVALVWMIIAQLHIDKELYKYSRHIEDLRLMELVYFSEKMFLGGLIVMFVGMFVTLTNLVAIFMGVISILVYFRSVYKYRV